MNSQKFVISSIVGGVIYFLLGWLFYGNLLKEFLENNAGSATGVSRGEDMVWWALGLGNLVMAMLMAYVLGKANVSSAAAGAAMGFTVGLLTCLGIDLMIYGTSNIMTTKSLAADVAVATVMSAIVGAVIGLIYGMSKKTVTAT